ncbi:MAG: beta-barrel assembly-enhancing protease [Thalassotalea sp.]
MLIKIKKLLLTSSISLALCAANVHGQLNDKNKLPEIGAAGTSVLSIEKERIIGEAMMRQLRSQQGVMNDPVLMEYINTLGNNMVKNANDVNYAFEFFLINNNDINAFAFFGGHIGVHSGLITTASNESELASVIAHEISHVTQRHLARKIEAQSRTQPLSTAGLISGILIALVNPTVGMAALSTSIAASQQASINYTRSNEQEADRVGIALLANSGFDPYGAPNFFGKLAEKYRYTTKPPAMLLTHPLPDSRISDARIRAQSYPVRPLAPSLNFELAKARIISRYQNNPSDNITFFEKQLSKKRYAIKEAAEYGLAISYFENKEYDKAQALLSELLMKDSKNLFYLDVLSDIGIATKAFDKTIEMLTNMHKLMPNNQVVSLNFANVLLEAGKIEEAGQLLRDFLLVKPEHFIAYDLLSAVYKKQNDTAMMHATQAEIYALLGAYPRAVDALQTAYTHANKQPLLRKRFKARILQFQDQQDKLKRL